jgi:hypothetical protein
MAIMFSSPADLNGVGPLVKRLLMTRREPLAGLTIQPGFDPSSPSLARQIYPPPRERGADRRPVYTPPSSRSDADLVGRSEARQPPQTGHKSESW